MSQELTSARRALSRVSTDLKQGQIISAATAVRDGARLFGRVPMMKNEHEEFSALLTSASDLLQYNESVTALFPLAIKYTRGQEDELASLMNQLIEVLQEESTEQAVKKHKAYQEAQLAKGHKELKEGQFDEGRRTLDQLAADYSTEGTLVTEIGETFMNAGLLDDAVRHFLLAARLMPDSARVLNRLGIVLRKLKRFDEGEIYFNRAIVLEPGDPNLYFNCARLYFDWGRWEKALEFGQKALELDPEFGMAAKLVAYVEKNQAQE